MIAFHSVLPEIAQREVRCIHVSDQPDLFTSPGLPPGEYAFAEFYCEDLNCDCRRVFIQVLARHDRDRVVASINYGWEDEEFYRQKMPWDPNAPAEVVNASLDPLNTQSACAADLLEIFRQQVKDDSYRLRLQRHSQMLRDEIRRRQPPAPPPGPAPVATVAPVAPAPLAPPPAIARIPTAHRDRFDVVATMLAGFGATHLDAELTGFTLELWQRICRRKSPDCLRGKPGVWAASVVHVIARMNFLFDRSQPVHLTFDTICNFFGVNKTTIGGKATGIEHTLRLRPHSEPGLCRSEFMESFTMVQLSNGIVLSFKMAKRMGYLPPGVTPADLS